MPWWEHIRGRPFYHPLDETHPAARLFMLKRIIQRQPNSRIMREARNALQRWPWIRRLIAELPDEETPPPSAPLWHPRYRTPFWQLRLLAEFEVRFYDEHLAAATDWLLSHAPPSSPYSDGHAPPAGFEAILLSVPVAFGFEEDERVRARLGRLYEMLRRGDLSSDPIRRVDELAQVAFLFSLQKAPPQNLVQAVAEALLSAPSAHLPPRWWSFGAPIFDEPDLLFATRVLIDLGIRDPRLQTWVTFIEHAQRDDMRAGITLQKSRYEAAGHPLEDAGAFSRWLTAQALYILNAWYGG